MVAILKLNLTAEAARALEKIEPTQVLFFRVFGR